MSEAVEGERRVILEVGCGVGNFLFPVLEELPNVFFYACDFSPRAIDLVKVWQALIGHFTTGGIFLSLAARCI